MEKEEGNLGSPLPAPTDDNYEKLQRYYAQYGISTDSLREDRLPYRFVRLHPAFDKEETLKQLKVSTYNR
jgi:hypothetical protein